MDQLWAPWRMPFIEGKEPRPGCIFCSKPAEDADEENLIVYRARHCFVILNLYPYNSGHLLVVPFQHAARLEDIEPEVGAELFHVSQRAAGILREAMAPDGFNFGINQGSISGAGIADHIHLHVVPRWGGDTNFMPVLADTKVMPELLSATANKIRPMFSRLESST